MSLPFLTDPPDSFLVSVHGAADNLHLSLSGELDIATVPQLHHAMRTVLYGTRTSPPLREHVPVSMDLSGLSFLDVAGLGALVDAHHAVAAAGSRLTLTGARPLALRMMEITGVCALLGIRHPASSADAGAPAAVHLLSQSLRKRVNWTST